MLIENDYTILGSLDSVGGALLVTSGKVVPMSGGIFPSGLDQRGFGNRFYV